MRNKTAVLLINVGTPDDPSVRSVRRFLFQFLNDKYVIDLPYLLRKFLVNCIIVPFRAPKSAKLYELLWDEKGSPLLYLSESLKDKLQSKLPGHDIFLGMRYGNPSIESVIKKVKKDGYSNLICIPLYPQYATSTTLTSMVEVEKQIEKYKLKIPYKFVDQFFQNKDFIDSFVASANNYDLSSYDHIIFSYHGLPVNQVENTHKGSKCEDLNCIKEYKEENKFCYHAACYATTRLLVKELNLNPDQYTTCFQSRLSKNWLKPFSDDVIIQKAKEGKKRILVFCPAFVTDCLETTIEIGYEYAELFKENGGEKLQLVENLNDSDEWTECLKGMIEKNF